MGHSGVHRSTLEHGPKPKTVPLGCHVNHPILVSTTPKDDIKLAIVELLKAQRGALKDEEDDDHEAEMLARMYSYLIDRYDGDETEKDVKLGGDSESGRDE